jgi:hypothetical protein
MTTFDLERHDRLARDLLEMTALDGMMFQPMLLAVRGGEEVCLVIPAEGAGTEIAMAATAMTGGFRADQLLIIADSYTSLIEKNPLTGEDWRGGEMAMVVAEVDAIGRGWVTEALTVSLVSRDQDIPPIIRAHAYVRHEGGRIEWSDRPSVPPGAELAVGRLVEVFDGPVLPERVPPEVGDPLVAQLLIHELGCRQVLLVGGG